MSDIEAATWSEAAASNNVAAPNGWPEGMAPSQVNDCSREFMGAVKREWNRSHATISSTGSANAYVLTHTTAPAAYINGQRFSFVASFANTGSATANVDVLGAKTINKHGGAGLTTLSSGDIQIGHHVTLEYDSSANVLVLISPTPAASGVGTMAAQDSNNVNISGGTIAGITDLLPADGGTGRSTLTNHGVLIGQGTGAINSTSAGSAGQVLTSNGAAADPTFQTGIAGAGTTYSNYVLLTSGTTWSVPGGVTQVLAILQAGGAGGGGYHATSGNAASAGGTAGANVAAQVAVSGTVTYAIGAAGSGGNNSGGSGTDGGDTTFGTITAKGGKGGAGVNGTGGSAATAAPAISPLVPSAGVAIISTYIADPSPTAGSSGVGGTGTSSPFGAGHAPVGNGSIYGGAGSGNGGGSSGTGGNGAAGCIVIFY